MIMRSLLFAFLAGAMLLSAMFACEDPNYRYNEAWDADGDGALEARDFYTNVQSDEFYAQWDVDDDMRLDTDEFTNGIEQFGVFDEWDVDNDETINEAEFANAFGDAGYFDGWDVDGSAELDRDELYAGLHTTLDADTDGLLARSEFDEGGEMF